jgi:UTP--glucose-1-phosphate uridylyltransferase
VSVQGLRAAEAKMREEGVPEAAINAFRHYYEQLESGTTGTLPDRQLEPVDDLPDADALPEARDVDGLDRTVVVKLNGGLGTSMGMSRAKSLIEAKDGLSFLDIVARQVLQLRDRTGARLPLVLMNSFYTREESLAALGRHPGLAVDVPLDFVQNKEPKLGAADHAPVEWRQDPGLEWCPPGHGDLYTALVSSGMLDALRARGYEYAFVSNSDNLGAVLEPRILGWFAAEGIPFAMEAVIGTESDRKGGHLARRLEDGRLVLRESAQVPDEDADSFTDFRRWRYYNTNNLWVDLRALSEVVGRSGGFVPLPLIANRKTVDPADGSTPPVIQLETAMGAAIGAFPGAEALVVPRGRFVPVKTTNDLLVLRSDAYRLTPDARVEAVDGVPFVDLDPDHFKRLRDFDARFGAGPPSLARCRRLVVRGDVAFGARVTVVGSVEISHDAPGQLRITDGAVLEGAADAAGRPRLRAGSGPGS